jgi:hypothetical protein
VSVDYSVHEDFVADPTAPAKARAFVSSTLLGTSPALTFLAFDIILAASELVTNSVQAGANVVGLTLEVGDEALELAVDDDAGGWPTTGSTLSDAAAPTGRGLALVAVLASSQTTVALAPRGKRVMARWLLPDLGRS